MGFHVGMSTGVEVTGFPRAGVTGACVLGTELRSSAIVVLTLNNGTISPAP